MSELESKNKQQGEKRRRKHSERRPPSKLNVSPHVSASATHAHCWCGILISSFDPQNTILGYGFELIFFIHQFLSFHEKLNFLNSGTLVIRITNNIQSVLPLTNTKLSFFTIYQCAFTLSVHHFGQCL